MSFVLAGVGLTHANGFTALSDIALQAERGEHIALIGPSGAGKSSLIALLGTALAPSAGQATLLDILKIGGFPGQVEVIDKNTSGSTH